MYSFAGLAEYCVVPTTAVFALPEPLLAAGLYEESYTSYGYTSTWHCCIYYGDTYYGYAYKECCILGRYTFTYDHDGCICCGHTPTTLLTTAIRTRRAAFSAVPSSRPSARSGTLRGWCHRGAWLPSAKTAQRSTGRRRRRALRRRWRALRLRRALWLRQRRTARRAPSRRSRCASSGAAAWAAAYCSCSSTLAATPSSPSTSLTRR